MSVMQAGRGTLPFGRPSSLRPAGERTDARSRRARTQRGKRTYATKGGGATPSAADHPCAPISNRSRTKKAAHEDASFPPLLICAYVHNTNRVISRSTYRVPHFPSRFPQKKEGADPRLSSMPDRNNTDRPQSNSFRRFCTAETCQYIPDRNNTDRHAFSDT